MTLQANFFQTDISPLVDARDERRRTRALARGGLGVAQPGDFKVTAVAGQLAVDVAACAEGGGLVWAPGRFNHRGAYFLYNDAVERIVLDPASPSQARTDLIVLSMHDGEYEGDAAFTFTTTKVTGTAGGGVPTTTGDMYVLAEVAVPAAATSIGVITDRRSMMSTTLPYTARIGSAAVSGGASGGIAPPGYPGYWDMTAADTLTFRRAGLVSLGISGIRSGAASDFRLRLDVGAADLIPANSGAGGTGRGGMTWVTRVAVNETAKFYLTNTLGGPITVNVMSNCAWLSD